MNGRERLINALLIPALTVAGACSPAPQKTEREKKTESAPVPPPTTTQADKDTSVNVYVCTDGFYQDVGQPDGLCSLESGSDMLMGNMPIGVSIEGANGSSNVEQLTDENGQISTRSKGKLKSIELYAYPDSVTIPSDKGSASDDNYCLGGLTLTGNSENMEMHILYQPCEDVVLPAIPEDQS